MEWWYRFLRCSYTDLGKGHDIYMIKSLYFLKIEVKKLVTTQKLFIFHILKHTTFKLLIASVALKDQNLNVFIILFWRCISILWAVNFRNSKSIENVVVFYTLCRLKCFGRQLPLDCHYRSLVREAFENFGRRLPNIFEIRSLRPI